MLFALGQYLKDYETEHLKNFNIKKLPSAIAWYCTYLNLALRRLRQAGLIANKDYTLRH